MKTTNIRAEIPGTVSYQYVDDGAKVERGAKVVAVECMKQLWDLTAPAAGTVRHIIPLGGMVEQNEILATIESDEEQ